MSNFQPHCKRIRPTEVWGRGVTAALRTFNPAGGGSNPSGPTRCGGDSYVAQARRVA